MSGSQSSPSPTPVLWTSEQAADATGGQNRAPWQASGLSIDSRNLKPGDLFVALAGPNFDGHDFITAALEAGAAGVMAHRLPEGLASDAPLLLVGDTLDALTALGIAGRARSKAKLAGVTGSVGKTGCKEALRLCLSDQAATTASAASLNNHWGVPLSLARMPPDATYGVFEIGMNHPGEISVLTRMVRPQVALITTIEPAHTAFFDSVADIADAKAEIFEGMEPDGVAVLNRDNPFFPVLVERALQQGLQRIIAFGRHGEADARLIDYSPGPAGNRISALIGGAQIDYWIAMPGQHWVLNSLAVLATVQALGADVPRAAASLGQVQALDGRGKQHKLALAGGELLLIDDSYNANPTSMKAAFEVLGGIAPAPGGRRIAVLGDMLELGPTARELHASLAGPLTQAGVDLVFSCGENMAALHEALPKALRGRHTATSSDLIAAVTDAVAAGDTVLIKGSLGSRMAVLVNALKALGDAGPRRANGE